MSDVCITVQTEQMTSEASLLYMGFFDSFNQSLRQNKMSIKENDTVARTIKKIPAALVKVNTQLALH